jgi:glutamine synthetase
MVSMARTLILPAGIDHQTRLAEAVGATQAADVECEELRKTLEEHVGLVARFKQAIEDLDTEAAHEDADVLKHARHIKAKIRPAMEELRRIADELETRIAADQWPMPTYRELLFIK